MLAFNLSPMTHDPLMQQALDALLSAPLLHSRRACGVVPSLARHIAAHVAEDEDTYVMTVEAPGVSADELSISFERDVLTVSASAQTNGTFSFKRQAKLPNADAESATATHKDGVLTITLKKMAPPSAVLISVSDVPATEDEGEESAKPYTLTIAAPGVKASDIRIEASQAALSIHGETSGAHGTFGVQRAYKLPYDADATAATATHVDGILSVTLPTRPTPDATAIQITTAPTEEVKTDKAGSGDGKTLEAGKVAGEAGPSSNEVPKAAPKAEEMAAEEWLAEWDTMLDDLAEMGFDNHASNRAALAKHSGSIKRAVKELVASRVGM